MKTETGTFTDLSKTLGRCVSVADSPCIGICSTTQFGDDRCKGCGRTQTEIRDWGTFSDTEKKIIKIALCVFCVLCGKIFFNTS